MLQFKQVKDQLVYAVKGEEILALWILDSVAYTVEETNSYISHEINKMKPFDCTGWNLYQDRQLAYSELVDNTNAIETVKGYSIDTVETSFGKFYLISSDNWHSWDKDARETNPNYSKIVKAFTIIDKTGYGFFHHSITRLDFSVEQKKQIMTDLINWNKRVHKVINKLEHTHRTIRNRIENWYQYINIDINSIE